MKKRRGDFIVDIVLASLLITMFLHGMFSMRKETFIENEERYAMHELAIIANAVKNYTNTHKEVLFENPNFQRVDGNESAFYVPDDTFLNANITKYLPNERNFSLQRNIWGDRYRVVFIRSSAASNTEDSTDLAGSDTLSAYVVATGGTRKNKTAGSMDGDQWLATGMRRCVLRAGASFGYVEGGRLVGGGWETNLGLARIGAVNGDIAYLTTFNIEDMTANALVREQTGMAEDQTMHADLDMNDNNMLNVRYFETQALDVSSARFDSSLYESAREAELSCKNNWVFIRDKDGVKRYVASDGRVHSSWTNSYVGSGEVLGTLGMNGADKEMQVLANETSASRIDTLGRVYYISPTQADIPGRVNLTDPNRRAENEIFATKSQLAVCKIVNGQRTLAYIGDNRVEDKVAFVVSAVDGDYIPPYFCPGQDANVAGGGTNSLRGSYSVNHLLSSGSFGTNIESETLFSSGRNADSVTSTSGIMPRLFVMPQFVSTGKRSFPLHGIRAWAETLDAGGGIHKGWIIRLNALIDRQNGPAETRSYWIGNIGAGKRVNTPENSNRLATSTQAGYATTTEIKDYASGLIGEFSGSGVGANANELQYLRAVVIGVCSGKRATF